MGEKKKGAVRVDERSLIEFVVAMKPTALARMWVDFNRWMWPKDLPVRFKPMWWDGDVVDAVDARERRARKHGLCGPLMDHAARRASESAIDKAWREQTRQRNPCQAKSKPTPRKGHR